MEDASSSSWYGLSGDGESADKGSGDGRSVGVRWSAMVSVGGGRVSRKGFRVGGCESDSATGERVCFGPD